MTTNSGKCDIIIIGAGPAGLFCALQIKGAAGRNLNVVVLEKNASCGKKLLITGTGQCNITHSGDIREFFTHYGDHGTFLRTALLGFTNKNLITFFESSGLAMVTDANGKVFPATRKASDVLDLLLTECLQSGVEVRCGEAVLRIDREKEVFFVSTETARHTAAQVVIATGGASYPGTGSTGDGYRLAAGLGQPVTPIRPALVSVSVRDYLFPHLAGISFEGVPVSLFRDGRKVRQSTGDLLFTHAGLSGPVILDLSRYIAAGDMLKVSFIPGMHRETVEKDLMGKIASHSIRQVRTILADYPLPERFIKELMQQAGMPMDLRCAHISKRARNALITYLLEFPFRVKDVGGFHEAMVTAGGISLPDVDPKTMASKRVPGLFFIGEVLDIDGDTGGYNLQAAFSTAFAAARAITARKTDESSSRT